MEGHCSTSQSPQWAVVPMEEDEEEEEFWDVTPCCLNEQFPMMGRKGVLQS